MFSNTCVSKCKCISNKPSPRHACSSLNNGCMTGFTIEELTCDWFEAVRKFTCDQFSTVGDLTCDWFPIVGEFTCDWFPTVDNLTCYWFTTSHMTCLPLFETDLLLVYNFTYDVFTTV